jgi:hypothetical protein
LRIVSELEDSPMPPLQTLAKTLKSWREPIVRMWRFTKTNGITEGLHGSHQPVRVRLPELSELPQHCAASSGGVHKTRLAPAF